MWTIRWKLSCCISSSYSRICSRAFSCPRGLSRRFPTKLWSRYIEFIYFASQKFTSEHYYPGVIFHYWVIKIKALEIHTSCTLRLKINILSEPIHTYKLFCIKKKKKKAYLCNIPLKKSLVKNTKTYFFLTLNKLR